MLFNFQKLVSTLLPMT